jgi:hypothetical protein
MLGSCLFWHNHHQMRSWLAWNFWTAFEKEHWQISNICVSLSNMVTLPWPRTVLWVLSHYGWEENGIILVQWKQCKLLSFGTRLWKLSEKRKKNWSCIWKISAELNLLWSWLQINDARIKRRHAWIMFGIVFGTLLGVSLILISRIDQHLACRKSSLAALCRSGNLGSLLYVPSEWWDFLFALFSFMYTPLSSVLYTTDGECGSPTQCQLHNIHWRQFLWKWIDWSRWWTI